MHVMDITKTSLMTAIIIPFILTNTCAATLPFSSLDSATVVVEASGNVPGFTETQLATYLARRLHEETTDPWQFSAGKPRAAPAPNRVVWSFKPSASNGRLGPIEDSRRRHIRRFISALR
jgi:hypothetical protein